MRSMFFNQIAHNSLWQELIKSLKAATEHEEGKPTLGDIPEGQANHDQSDDENMEGINSDHPGSQVCRQHI